MPRNGRKRAAVKRPEFAILATRTKQRPGWVEGYLAKPKHRVHVLDDAVLWTSHQGKGHKEPCCVLTLICKGQKQQIAAEKISLHRWLKLERCTGAGLRERRTVSSPVCCIRELRRKEVWGQARASLHKMVSVCQKLSMEQLVVFAASPYCEAENTSLLPAVF